MTTKRLYHDDAYQEIFSAQVLSCSASPDGEQYGVILEQTVFYPEGGGQPWDTGILNGQEVVRVENDGDRVVHIVGAEIPVGSHVQGHINWERRFDHMQQHTGQHLLSAVIQDQFDLRTVAFHLGSEICTIDLHADFKHENDIHRVEDMVNEVIVDARDLDVLFPQPHELKNLPLRKDIAVDEEEIRVVVIPGVDHSGCCGTHVSNTGELGLLKVLRTERVKGGLCRVHFLAGSRALRDYQRKHDVMTSICHSFSANVESVEAAVEKLRQNEKELRRELRATRNELHPHRAATMLADAESVGGVKVVVGSYPDFERQDLNGISAAMCDREQAVVFLLGGTDALAFQCRRSDGVDLDVGKLVRETLKDFGLKGGGNAQAAQGGGVLTGWTTEQLLEAVTSAITRSL